MQGDFMLHSGAVTDFLIDAGALTTPELKALAAFIGKRLLFSEVEAIPRGGVRLANELLSWSRPDAGVLIVDDVLTTGASMERARGERENVQGVVIFARGPYPVWVKPVFVMPGRWR